MGIATQRGTKSGGYAASASKTVGAPCDVVFTAFSDERLRGRWLGRVRYELRRTIENESVRIRWGNDSDVRVSIESSGNSRCRVEVHHARLSGGASTEKAKLFWTERLERLAALVEGERAPGNSRAATGPASARTRTTPRPRPSTKTARPRAAKRHPKS